jgi:hypothetical protein
MFLADPSVHESGFHYRFLQSNYANAHVDHYIPMVDDSVDYRLFGCVDRLGDDYLFWHKKELFLTNGIGSRPNH